MAYNPKDFKNASSGGPWTDRSTRRGNDSRPQNYTGFYVTDIKYKGDGKQASDPAPQQGFRKDLPRPEVSGRLLDGQYAADGVEPDWQEIQFKTWR
jgi:hypothetical protein